MGSVMMIGCSLGGAGRVADVALCILAHDPVVVGDALQRSTIDELRRPRLRLAHQFGCLDVGCTLLAVDVVARDRVAARHRGRPRDADLTLFSDRGESAGVARRGEARTDADRTSTGGHADRRATERDGPAQVHPGLLRRSQGREPQGRQDGLASRQPRDVALDTEDARLQGGADWSRQRRRRLGTLQSDKYGIPGYSEIHMVEQHLQVARLQVESELITLTDTHALRRQDEADGRCRCKPRLDGNSHCVCHQR